MRKPSSKDSHVYEVIVGNIGLVYCGTDKTEAENRFETYVTQSSQQYGRAGGETVTLMCDDEVYMEWEQ